MQCRPPHDCPEQGSCQRATPPSTLTEAPRYLLVWLGQECINYLPINKETEK